MAIVVENNMTSLLSVMQKKRKESLAQTFKAFKNLLFFLVIVAIVTTVLQVLNVDGGGTRETCVRYASGSTPLPIYFQLNATNTMKDYDFVQDSKHGGSHTRCIPAPQQMRIFLTVCHVLAAGLTLLFAKAGGASTVSSLSSWRFKTFAVIQLLWGCILMTFFILEFGHLLNIYPFSQEHPLIAITNGFESYDKFVPTPRVPLGLTTLIIIYSAIFNLGLALGFTKTCLNWAKKEEAEIWRIILNERRDSNNL